MCLFRLVFLKRFILEVLIMRIGVVCPYDCRYLQRPETSDPLELELEAVVSHLQRVLGTGLWFSTRACVSGLQAVFLVLVL